MREEAAGRRREVAGRPEARRGGGRAVGSVVGEAASAPATSMLSSPRAKTVWQMMTRRTPTSERRLITYRKYEFPVT